MELSLYHLLALILALIFIIKRRLSKPISLPIIGHLHLLQDPIHQSLTLIAKKYGHVLHLRFGSRRVLVVSSPSVAKECFTKNDIIFANRPRLISGKYFGYNHTAPSLAPYGPRWREHRRFTAVHALSPSRLPSFSSDLRSLVLKLYSGSGDGFIKTDVRPMLFEMMMNVMAGLIAGKRYYGEGSADPEEGRRFRKVVEEVFLLSGASTVEDFIPAARWLRLGGAAKRMERVGQEMDKFFQGLIEERRRVEKWKERNTIIDTMLSMQENEPENYSDVAIKGMMTSLLVAGTETSTGTMEWVLALLLNHPETLKKAKDEIKEQETLRLFPAGPLLVPRESSEDCTVSKSYIPKGTMLLVNAYAMQRDPELWESPLEFKPERFDGGIDGDQGYKYIPFGSGRRRCPGENLSWRVMGLTLGGLIQCFDWQRVGKELVDLNEGVGLSMPMATSLQAMYKPCQEMITVLSQL
ncbi:hypothetical protein J5N97_008492 [Dioscorea zingiberensis]|uniref:Cytochrome P450 n=1 Tax=Dioscorea zingiberensis TaxID=325984 RepID=A0A9D5HLF5_9LILI|nr:hypothetical protein J5N97_008492 [Dioscorea zingiberensis]